MKTAISIPDELYAEAEQLARRLKQPRSRIYAEALREYLARHNDDAITEALNRVYDQVGTEVDPFIDTASKRLLKQVEW